MLNLTVVVDNDEAIAKFRELQKVAKTTTSNIVSDSDRMDMAMRKLATSLGSLGVGFSLTEFARKVSMVRGEFQQLEVAFTTMLGSKADADALMAKTVDFAAKTPFDLQGVASASKQLLAYGSNAEEVTDELRMLGDIAAGLSMPLGDLVYLYGTTRTQGRMFTMDLRQFMGRGIPLAEELAKKFGVTKDQVSKLVTEGKVGFNDMKDALVAMTSEGGTFYNLMEEQSKTITGKMSNLGDAVDQMFNNIGKQSEDIISGAIDSAAYLVENYEKIGKVLMDIIVAYGSYKAAVMTVNALNKARVIYLAAEVAATKLSAVANKQLTASNILLAKSLKTLNVAKYLTNPYVLAGAAIGALIFGTYKLITAKSFEEKAQEKVNKQMDEYNQKAEEEKQKASENISKMKDANISTYERVKAYNDLVAAYPELLDKYDKEKIKLMEIAELEKEIAGITQQRALKEANDKIAEYDKKIAGGVPKTYTVSSSMGPVVDTSLETNNQWVADRAAWVKKRDKMLADQAEAEFDALPDADKIKKYQQDIDALTTTIENYNKEIDELGNREGANITIAKRDKAEAEKADLERRKKTLEDAIKKKSAGGGTDEEEEKKKQKAIAKAREDAIKEANKAQYELEKERINNKIDLLEFEKNEELKAIDEQLKATTDAETKAALQRQRAATSMRYDIQIGAEYDNQIKEQREGLNSLLEEYADYQTKRKLLIQKYENDIIEAMSTNINGENDALIKLIADARDKAVQELDSAELEKSDFWIKIFSDAEKMASSSIEKIINDIELLLSYLKDKNSVDFNLIKAMGLTEQQINGIDAERLKEIVQSLIDKRNELNSRNPFKNLVQGFKDLKNAGDDVDKKFGARQNIIKSIGQVGEFLGSVGSDMKEAGENLGSDFMSGLGGVLSDAGDVIGKSMQGAMTGLMIGGPIGAIIGGVFSGLMSILSKSGSKSEDENLKAFKAFNEELRILKEQARLDSWEDTIFGSDGFGKAIHSMDIYKEKLKEFNDIRNKIINRPVYQDTGYGPIQFPNLDWFGNNPKGTLSDALRGMKAKTRHSTWFRASKYESLGDLLPELFSEDGEISMSALKEFVDSDVFKQLSNENRELIAELVRDWEMYEDALSEVKDYLSGVFGGLGDSLMDSMTNAFIYGTDAAKDFGDALSETLEKFAQDMVYTLMFADLFKKAEEDMMKIMEGNSTEEEKFSAISNIFSNLLNGVEAQSDNAMNLYQKIKDRAKESGIDIFGKDDKQQDATSKGFQAMSQETGSELNGRFTDIQGKVTEIRDAVLQSIVSGNLRLGEMINIRDITIQLNGNVEQIKTYSMVLPEMSSTLTAMNRKIQDSL